MADSNGRDAVRSMLNKGPHGLGDPDDMFLRKVEREILIPKKMRDKAKTEKCIEEVAAFSKCCKENNIAMVVKCQDVNAKMKECFTFWYTNEKFKKECENEYLKERSEYRRTGIPKKFKEKMGEESTE